MYETILHNLILLANDTEKRVLIFAVAKDTYLNFDMFDESFYWTDDDDEFIRTASQQSVVSVLGSQYGQQSS